MSSRDVDGFSNLRGLIQDTSNRLSISLSVIFSETAKSRWAKAPPPFLALLLSLTLSQSGGKEDPVELGSSLLL